MRVFTTLLVGLLLGVTVGAAIVFLNPIVEYSGQEPAGELLYYQSQTDQFMLTHGETLPVPLQPGDIPPMWEATIKGTALSVFPLNNADGNPIALASRISLLEERSDFLVNGPRMESSWLLSYPGKGTLFIEEQENIWPVMRDGVIPVWLLSRRWSGESEMLPTVGPDVEGARIIAGSGEFSGAHGVIRQRYRVQEFGRQELSWEAEVGLQLTSITEQAEAAE